MTASLWNPSTAEFAGLSAVDQDILNQICTRWDPADLPEPAALEPFDSWLERAAAIGACVVLKSDERNAQKLHLAFVAERDDIPVIRRVAEPEPAPARARSVAEYLEQKGETREAAEARIRERFGKPGQEKHYDKRVAGDGRPVEVGPPGHPSRGHIR